MAGSKAEISWWKSMVNQSYSVAAGKQDRGIVPERKG